MKKARFSRYATMVAGSLSASLASGVEPLPESLVACRDETDDARRLACFDRELERWATTPEERFGLRSGQALPRANQETPGNEPADEKGKEKDKLQNITASVTHIARRPQGEIVLTLDNGQVWAQTQAGSPIRVMVGDEVTIRAATFGSFLLSSPRKGGATRVARVK